MGDGDGDGGNGGGFGGGFGGCASENQTQNGERSAKIASERRACVQCESEEGARAVAASLRPRPVSQSGPKQETNGPWR